MTTRTSTSRHVKPDAALVRPPAPAATAMPNEVVSARPSFLEPEQRSAMIAEAAYYRAEHRGFASGFELEDWLEAEAEIDRALTRESLLSG